MTKEQKERNRQWVAALRSGKYKQGRTALHPSDEYCCLGVACEVYQAATNQCKWKVDDGDEYPSFVCGDIAEQGSGYTPPSNVVEWFGWSDRNPQIKSEGESLAELNDGGCDFDEIANLIEDQFAL